MGRNVLYGTKNEEGRAKPEALSTLILVGRGLWAHNFCGYGHSKNPPDYFPLIGNRGEKSKAGGGSFKVKAWEGLAHEREIIYISFLRKEGFQEKRGGIWRAQTGKG